jgi:acetylglutamate kinase
MSEKISTSIIVTHDKGADFGNVRISSFVDRMIMLTDIAGIMRDKDDPDSLISEISIGEALDLCNDGTIAGGMIPKVECCINAIEHGVKKVTILDGRVPHAILMELLTDEGAGTMVVRGEEGEE